MLNYGMAIASSGALSQLARMDVLSNNLANVNTVGFRPQSITLEQRDPVTKEDGVAFMESDKLLERLGGGVMPSMTYTSTTQGALNHTGRDLDVAIQGDGYLMVHNGSADQPVSLTRDGRMLINPQGNLIHAASGRPILNNQGQRIELMPNEQIQITGDGTLLQLGQEMGQLGFANVNNPELLTKQGDGMMRPSGDQWQQRIDPNGLIVQGSVEGSPVNPISAMMGISRAGGSARRSLGVIGQLNDVVSLAINRLGSVS